MAFGKCQQTARNRQTDQSALRQFFLSMLEQHTESETIHQENMPERFRIQTVEIGDHYRIPKDQCAKNHQSSGFRSNFHPGNDSPQDKKNSGQIKKQIDPTQKTDIEQIVMRELIIHPFRKPDQDPVRRKASGILLRGMEIQPCEICSDRGFQIFSAVSKP